MMTNQVRIWRNAWGEWLTDCRTHDLQVESVAWVDAMEAAYGHIAMWHPRACPERAVYDHIVFGCTDPTCDPWRPGEFVRHLLDVAEAHRTAPRSDAGAEVGHGDHPAATRAQGGDYA